MKCNQSTVPCFVFLTEVECEKHELGSLRTVLILGTKIDENSISNIEVGKCKSIEGLWGNAGKPPRTLSSFHSFLASLSLPLRQDMDPREHWPSLRDKMSSPWQ
jgi:hypothetical protein